MVYEKNGLLICTSVVSLFRGRMYIKKNNMKIIGLCVCVCVCACVYKFEKKIINIHMGGRKSKKSENVNT